MKETLTLRRFFRSRGASKGMKGPTLPSLLKAMTVLVPRKVIKETLASSHDRRQWGTLAAAWVGVSEREFFQAAATEMKLPFHEHPLVPDLSVFGVHSRKVLEELRRIGASVVLEGARIRVLVCVDPSEMRGSSLFTGAQEIAVSSWSEISRALDMSERALHEIETRGIRTGSDRKRELCLSALAILMGEAKGHGASTFDLVTSEGKTRYQFYTSNGKLAVGVVHPEVVADLLSLLREADGAVITLNEGANALVRGYGSGRDFKISIAHQVDQLSPTFASSEEVAPRIREVPSPPTSSTASYRLETETIEDDRRNDGEPILIVDDNPMFCRILQKLLAREGFAPAFAGNGVEAFEKLMSGVTLLPKIIVCDLHMPIMNGREFISRIKEHERLKAIPIVVLTSDEDVEAELQLLRSGAETLISKAKDPRVLTSHLKRLLRKSGLREAA